MSKLSRRNLLGAGAAAIAAPYFIPSTVFNNRNMNSAVSDSRPTSATL